MEEIKPGMIIHCKTEKQVNDLLSYLGTQGYYIVLAESAFRQYGDQTCFRLWEDDDEKGVTYADVEFYKTEGLEVIEMEECPLKQEATMTAEELVAWLKDNGTFFSVMKEVFGETGIFPVLQHNTPEEFVSKVANYKAKKPQPVELEWEDYIEIIDEYNAKTVYTRPKSVGFVSWAEEKYREWLREHNVYNDKGTVYCGHRPRVKEGE